MLRRNVGIIQKAIACQRCGFQLERHPLKKVYDKAWYKQHLFRNQLHCGTVKEYLLMALKDWSDRHC